MTMLEEDEYQALKEVIEHYMPNEQKHFEENLDDAQWQVLEEGGRIVTNHIFCRWQILKDFVDRMEDEGPRED